MPPALVAVQWGSTPEQKKGVGRVTTYIVAGGDGCLGASRSCL